MITLDLLVAPFGRHAQLPETHEPERQSAPVLQLADLGRQQTLVRHCAAPGASSSPQSLAKVHAPPSGDSAHSPPLQEPVQQSASEPHVVLLQSPGMQHLMLLQPGAEGQPSFVPQRSP